MADKLINIKADSADEFVEKAAKAVGDGDGEMGLTTFKITPKFKLEDDKITKITFEVEVTVTRAHWSGGKPDDKNKKAIKDAEELNRKHEEKHRKLAQDICAKEFAKAVKDLKGKSADDVQDAVEAITKKVNDAFDDLDGKEGTTQVNTDAKGNITVKQAGK